MVRFQLWSKPNTLPAPIWCPLQRFPAAQITGSAAPGYSSGDAITTMEELAREVLPDGYDFAWSGMAFEEKKSGATSMAASPSPHHRFSRTGRPVRVLDPSGVGHDGGTLRDPRRPRVQLAAGSSKRRLFPDRPSGADRLRAKNAVLRVTFAVELRRQGLSIMEATIKAGESGCDRSS